MKTLKLLWFKRLLWSRALIATIFFISGLAHADVLYKGVNFSGAEAGGCTTPNAKYGFKYIYPNTSMMDSFIAAGMNTFRLAFCWERLQPRAMENFDAAELARLDQTVNYLTSKKVYVILDPHNYAAYWGIRISKGTTNEMFADFWSRLATRYANNPYVFFGLMNEPNGISSEAWLEAANAAIIAIRNTSAKNLILVPGVAWTGAHSWEALYYGTPNGVTMLNVKDPANNYAIEVHQYLDKDSSGTKSDCLSEQIGISRIHGFTAWLRRNNKKAFLAEFAGGVNTVCFAALENLLNTVHANSDVWMGWTYWSTGPWQENYMFNLKPVSDPAKPNQIDVLKKFFGACPAPSADCALSPPTIKVITTHPSSS